MGKSEKHGARSDEVQILTREPIWVICGGSKIGNPLHDPRPEDLGMIHDLKVFAWSVDRLLHWGVPCRLQYFWPFPRKCSNYRKCLVPLCITKMLECTTLCWLCALTYLSSTAISCLVLRRPHLHPIQILYYRSLAILRAFTWRSSPQRSLNRNLSVIHMLLA